MAFWQSFHHKNVPAVLGIYPGFAKRKVIIPPISQLERTVVTNDWCIRVQHGLNPKVRFSHAGAHIHVMIWGCQGRPQDTQQNLSSNIPKLV